VKPAAAHIELCSDKYHLPDLKKANDELSDTVTKIVRELADSDSEKSDKYAAWIGRRTTT